MTTVDVFNRESACNITPNINTVMISISNPGDPAKLRLGWADILRLEFHDTTPAEGSSYLVLFTEWHAQRIRKFAEFHQDKDFVVHCDAGISRSVAVGVWLSETLCASLRTHAIGTTRLANGHVLALLRRKVWDQHFAERLAVNGAPLTKDELEGALALTLGPEVYRALREEGQSLPRLCYKAAVELFVENKDLSGGRRAAWVIREALRNLRDHGTFGFQEEAK